MTKRMIRAKATNFSNYELLDGKSIGEVIETLNTLISDGFCLEDKFDVSCYDDGYASISLEHYRIETDEECANRLAREETEQQRVLERKKQEYEQLRRELGYD